MNSTAQDTVPPKPAWQPLAPVERRIVGVLVEKAKTTPDVYPMSLNALCTGCNQKNNRDPVMQLTEDDVSESVARLRTIGAVEEVHGSGRVPRFRHHMYEWLGVDKVELAVMAELLLRGAQTEGELRGRAARMEPIADVAALRPVLASLKQKGLVVSLTSEGRGHAVTHTLVSAKELEGLKEFYASHEGRPRYEAATSHVQTESAAADLTALRSALDETRAAVQQLREDFDRLTQRCTESEQELRRIAELLAGKP